MTIHENIYGHAKRLNWIISNISQSDTIVELGCGTGYMITLPLACMGYNIHGVDLDKDSISLGQSICRRKGLNPAMLQTVDISNLHLAPDVVIAAEVLEHVRNEELGSILKAIRSKLEPGGRLLVTVPNGYGWFEIENFMWNKMRIGNILRWIGIVKIIKIIKQIFFGLDRNIPYYMQPSTLSSSPHLQCFTYGSIRRLLKGHGFEVLNIAGSVLIAGEISDLLFTGIKPIMRLNSGLGNLFPRFAAGFYIACKIIPQQYQA